MNFAASSVTCRRMCCQRSCCWAAGCPSAARRSTGPPLQQQPQHNHGCCCEAPQTLLVLLLLRVLLLSVANLLSVQLLHLLAAGTCPTAIISAACSTSSSCELAPHSWSVHQPAGCPALAILSTSATAIGLAKTKQLRAMSPTCRLSSSCILLLLSHLPPLLHQLLQAAA
jgi:hypothetical protein